MSTFSMPEKLANFEHKDKINPTSVRSKWLQFREENASYRRIPEPLGDVVPQRVECQHPVQKNAISSLASISFLFSMPSLVPTLERIRCATKLQSPTSKKCINLRFPYNISLGVSIREKNTRTKNFCLILNIKGEIAVT